MGRTSVVKNMEECYVHIILATAATIVAARSVGGRWTVSAVDTLAGTILAARGAGHTGSVAAYAVALTSVIAGNVITLGGETATFITADPPGTGVPFSGTPNIALTPTAVVAATAVGDMFAIVAQPTYTTSDLISYATAKSVEPMDLRREIRDKGVLNHRKIMAQQGGVLTLSAKYENAKKGLSKFVDQDIIVICEREDDRNGVVTEKEMFFGARINAIPNLNETEGDTDTELSIPISFEMYANIAGT